MNANDRVGASLIPSLSAAEFRGRPGPAAATSLAAADTSESDAEAALHLFDAIRALLLTGDAGAALALLDRGELRHGPDAERRVHACRAWAKQLQWNWYPGDVGGELPVDFPAEWVGVNEIGTGDPETVLLEAAVTRGPINMPSARALLAGNRGAPDRQAQLHAHFDQLLVGYAELTYTMGEIGAMLWSQCCRADILAAAGNPDPAFEHLGTVRNHYLEQGDLAGAARSLLMEGDWLAAPGSSPEALGFDLPSKTMADSPPAPDNAGADIRYRAAAELLAGLDEPRLHGALALRQALLSARADQFEAASAAHDRAREAWTVAGDAGALHLLTMHSLLLDLAAGRIASVRREAGSGWSMEARGPLADIVAWAEETGSPSFCTGLGRLAQAMAGWWRQAGALERAAAAYTLSVPLVGISGSVSPSYVLDEQATLEAERGFGARALVRLEQAVEIMPSFSDANADEVQWMSQASLVMSIVSAQQNRVTSSPTGRGLTGLRRSQLRLQELVIRSGVPPDPALSRSLAAQSQALAALVERNRAKSLGNYATEDGTTSAMVTQVTSALVDQSGTLDIIIALSRGRLAFAGGWIQEADRWFAAALRAAEAGGPAKRWLGVLVLVSQGRNEEAQQLLAEVTGEGFLSSEMLASLALRARLPAVAENLMGDRLWGQAGSRSWVDRSDQAELLLQLDRNEEALAEAEHAIASFEAEVGVLARDPDRVAKIDDVKVPALYVTAARAALALAEQTANRPSDGDGDDHRPSLLREAISFIDRSRSLATFNLIESRSSATGDTVERRWQEVATTWAAQFDRLLASYDGTVPEAERPAITRSLTAAEDDLIAVEAELEELDEGVLTEAHLPPALDVARLQRSLPHGVAAIEIHLFGRELLTAALTRDQVTVKHRRFARPVIEQLANQLWRNCSSGDPGPEAAELSTILLNPVADTIADCRRLIIVPMGAVSAVPFGLLPFEGGLLGDRHQLSYLPSLTFLQGERVDEAIAGEGVTVVGDPAFDPETHPELHQLEGALVEANAVADLYASDDCLVRDGATETEIRGLLDGRSIVHLAAHGRLDEAAPSTSSIVLAGVDELTVADLIGMRIATGLVVLSACDSGRGSATLGGDLVGLTRGLLAAGVERAVVSLWPVDDVVACVTMVRFHRLLKQGGMAPAAALAEAQRQLRTMDEGAVDAEYASLGGDPSTTERRSRRADGAMSPTRSALDLLVGDDPDFTDEPGFSDSPDPDDDRLAGAGSGRVARNWAPFILVGH